MAVVCRWSPTLTNFLRFFLAPWPSILSPVASLGLHLDELAPASGGGTFSLMIKPAPARVVSAVSCSPYGCAAGGSRVALNCVAVWFLLALAMGPMIWVL